jgi:phenylacetate-coenzyme A ligase PaaK-like adenylate-forming protein
MRSTIHPKVIASTGDVLDPKLKSYIEQAFSTTVFEVYGATETGPIAFQPPRKNKYKIMSDFLLLEVLNQKGEISTSKEPGHMIVTKLYAGGTPIIRYNALNDIISPYFSTGEKNSIFPNQIHRIYGRDTIRLFRDDGKVLLGSSLTTVFSRLLYKLETSKIRDLKVVQKSLDEINVYFVVDNKRRNQGVSIDKICIELAKGFTEVFGSSVEVNFKEVQTVSKDEPRIKSEVNPKEIKITGFA